MFTPTHRKKHVSIALNPKKSFWWAGELCVASENLSGGREQVKKRPKVPELWAALQPSTTGRCFSTALWHEARANFTSLLQAASWCGRQCVCSGYLPNPMGRRTPAVSGTPNPQGQAPRLPPCGAPAFLDLPHYISCRAGWPHSAAPANNFRSWKQLSSPFPCKSVLLTIHQTPIPCPPSSGIIGLSLFVHYGDISLIRECCRVRRSKERALPACALAASHTNCSSFFIVENKYKTPSPKQTKAENASFRQQASSTALYQGGFMTSQSVGQFLKMHSQSGKWLCVKCHLGFPYFILSLW